MKLPASLSLASSSINLDTTVAMTITISDDGSGGLAASSSGCTWRNMEGIVLPFGHRACPHACLDRFARRIGAARAAGSNRWFRL